jgi:hypothetical protein
MSKSLVSAQDRHFLAFTSPSFRNKERHQALARTCWHLSSYIAYSRKLPTHPIALSVKAQKKSGWNGSLTLPLSRGEKKEFQTKPHPNSVFSDSFAI